MSRKRVVDLETHGIYTYNKKDGFVDYDPFTFKHKGFDIKSLYEHYLHRKRLLQESVNYFQTLEKWLLENHVDSDSDTLYNLIDEMIDKVIVFRDNDNYHYFELNDEGYITEHRELSGKITKGDYNIPIDIEKGYYKINDKNEIIKDEEREEEEWNY